MKYRNLESIKKDVTAGKVECGFAFSEDFDEKFEEGGIRRSVTFWCTPMSAKGELIKENFYIAFFRIFISCTSISNKSSSGNLSILFRSLVILAI